MRRAQRWRDSETRVKRWEQRGNTETGGKVCKHSKRWWARIWLEGLPQERWKERWRKRKGEREGGEKFMPVCDQKLERHQLIKMHSTPDFYPSLFPPLILFLNFHPSFTFGIDGRSSPMLRAVVCCCQRSRQPYFLNGRVTGVNKVGWPSTCFHLSLFPLLPSTQKDKSVKRWGSLLKCLLLK